MENNVNVNVTGSVELGTEATEITSSKKITVGERFTSRALWVSVFGLVGLILEALGVFEKLGITNEGFDTVITSLGAILSVFGIINNPTDKSAL